MIECLECGYKGTPQFLNEAESLAGFAEYCPNCKGIQIETINQETIIKLATNEQ